MDITLRSKAERDVRILALYDGYAGKIFNLAYRFFGNYADAEDATSDIFLRAYRSMDTFRGESDVYTWLHRIAIHYCLNEQRRRSNNPVQSYDSFYDNGDQKEDMLSDPETPQSVLERREMQRVVQVAVAELRPGHRVPLILRGIQGLSYEEIANIMDVTPKIVKTRLYRARTAMRDMLAPYLEEWNREI
jgi:RNA polymerase sigma-70 factor (ECF subfamily)